MPALATAGAPGRAAERIGPVRERREHQPNPAEIEAREHVRGMAEPRRDRKAREVDRLYRDLTGSDPQVPLRSTRARDANRR